MGSVSEPLLDTVESSFSTTRIRLECSPDNRRLADAGKRISQLVMPSDSIIEPETNG
jgi:hypothetical protein